MSVNLLGPLIRMKMKFKKFGSNEINPPPLVQRTSTHRGPGSPSSIGSKMSKYLREDSATEDSGGGLSDIKDLEADDEFEMLALDGSANHNTYDNPIFNI
jgi:hypothetical protein